MTEGLVSTIIPVFNRSTLLVEAVSSALEQTYPQLEVIVVDDASTDDTPQVIASLCERDARVRSVRRENGGPGLARETGRQAARGEFIQYLDSDDLLLPRKFELQVAALRADPSAGIAYGITRYRDAAGDEIACMWKEANQVQRKMFPSFLVSRWWETVTPLFRRSVTDAAGPWTNLRLEEDWEYDCRIAALDPDLAFVDEVLAEHRDHVEARLSRGGNDPERLRMRARAHVLIAGHAQRAGIDRSLPAMQHLGRDLFHLARQCGAAGLRQESRELLTAAVKISAARDLRTYNFVARLIGVRNAGTMAETLDRFRSR
ncbi:MAG TPA: glycosyltransferase family A protein [Thermoanaerobaculia bacterium]|jgi:glycosyltransferase involved in cell wall biosynthesis|nr:glycosyltransferase family A protein [Thermoanaerobaculia bacterium]